MPNKMELMVSISKPDVYPRAVARLSEWLDRPLSNIACFISWLISTVIFFGIAGALGGPTEGDVSESAYGTWSVAHGNLSCIYPPAASHNLSQLADPFTLAAPLYPLVSGGLAALLRIGSNVSFPTTGDLGTHCLNAFNAIFKWSVKSSAILPTVRLSYFVWLVLAAGVVWLVRAANRGRRGWEALALVMIAATAPVVMCFTYYFHPQDVLAMGLVLGAVAAAMQGRWYLAGALMGLAFSSQQFALLVAVPLLVLAPARDRFRYLVGVAALLIVVDIPIVIATSGRGIRTVLLGSSRVGYNITSFGGTVVWLIKLHGVALFVVSRVFPIVLALAVTWWFWKRYGSDLLQPVPLMSLITFDLVTRLIFEENLFGYYFMATAVALVLMDVVGGRVRGQTLAWLGLFMVWFDPVHIGLVPNLTTWALSLYNDIPIALFAIGALCVVVDLINRRYRVYKYLWLVVVALTAENKLWGRASAVYEAKGWMFQIVLVACAILLAIGPLNQWSKSRLTREVVEIVAP